MKFIINSLLFALTIWVALSEGVADSGISLLEVSDKNAQKVKCLNDFINFFFQFQDLIIYKYSDLKNADDYIFDATF